METAVQITLEQAAFGAEVELSLNRLERCSRCGGSGAEPDSGLKTCPKCNGRGQVQTTTRSMFGQMIRVTTCDRCGGRGQVPEKPCSLCRGEGRVEGRAKLNVKVPPGIEDGVYLVLRGQGEAGPYGGPNGDLYVTVRIKPHPYLLRKGMDVIYEAEVNFPQAALGTEIKVPTLRGDASLKVPAGTQSGDILRMKGEGMTGNFGMRGDQLVHITVTVPKKLTRSQRELIEELGKELHRESSKGSWWRR